MKRALTIGALSGRTSCPPETIRYYEREGLLPKASRTAGNYRLYDASHVERLAFIRNCRALDMTLEEIRQLLGLRDIRAEECAAAHGLIDEHITHLGERIAELQQLKRQLQLLRQQCQPVHGSGTCGVLDGLGQKIGNAAKKSGKAHIRGAHGG